MRQCLAIAAVALGLASPPAVAAAGDGGLTQLPGAQGCIRAVVGAGNSKCPLSRAVGLLDASSAAVSPDGRFVYVTSTYESGSVNGAQGGTITVFSRDATGVLTQLPGAAGCVQEAGTKPIQSGCSTTAIGIRGAKTIALSPDGSTAYVAAINGSSIAAFARNAATGALTQLPGDAACVEDKADSPAECPVAVPGLHGVRWVTVSPDGRNVYASSPSRDAISLFTRDANTGAIAPLAGLPCIEDYKAYVPGTCAATGYGLNYPRMITVSPDGRNAYVASDIADSDWQGDAADGDAIAEFSRDPATGRLTQLPGADACVKDPGAPSDTKCSTTANGLVGAFAIGVSPDGKNAYAVGNSSDTLVVFTRDGATGALRQPPGRQTCFRDAATTYHPNCPLTANGIVGAGAVDISPDGRNVYVSAFFGAAIASFSRDPQTGDLTQLSGAESCARNYKSAKPVQCPVTTDGIGGPRAATISPDGTSVYAPASDGQTLAVFHRDAPPAAPPTLAPPPIVTPARPVAPRPVIGMGVYSRLSTIRRTGRLVLRVASNVPAVIAIYGTVRPGRRIRGARALRNFRRVRRVPATAVTFTRAGSRTVKIRLSRQARLRLARARDARLHLIATDSRGRPLTGLIAVVLRR